MANDPQSQTCQSGDVTVEYFVHGAGDTILLLPGASLDCSYLTNLADALADADYRAIRVNPRGAGKSQGPADDVTMESYADDTAILIDHLNVGPVDVAGHAFGNRVARATAHYHPSKVRSVILFAAGGDVAPKPDAAHALQVVMSPDASHEEVLKAMEYMVGDPKDVEKAWDAIKTARTTAVSAMQGHAMKHSGKDWIGAPGDWPWLIVQGSDDQIAPRENGENIKDNYGDKVTLETVDGAGHLMVVVRPEQTTDHVMSFLKERDEKA